MGSLEEVNGALKIWKEKFETEHGRKPSAADIRADPLAAEYFRQYLSLRQPTPVPNVVGESAPTARNTPSPVLALSRTSKFEIRALTSRGPSPSIASPSSNQLPPSRATSSEITMTPSFSVRPPLTPTVPTLRRLSVNTSMPSFVKSAASPHPATPPIASFAASASIPSDGTELTNWTISQSSGTTLSILSPRIATPSSVTSQSLRTISSEPKSTSTPQTQTHVLVSDSDDESTVRKPIDPSPSNRAPTAPEHRNAHTNLVKIDLRKKCVCLELAVLLSAATLPHASQFSLTQSPHNDDNEPDLSSCSTARKATALRED